MGRQRKRDRKHKQTPKKVNYLICLQYQATHNHNFIFTKFVNVPCSFKRNVNTYMTTLPIYAVVYRIFKSSTAYRFKKTNKCRKYLPWIVHTCNVSPRFLCRLTALIKLLVDVQWSWHAQRRDLHKFSPRKILKLSFIQHHIYINLGTSKKKYIYWTSEIVVQTFILENYDLNTNFE
jgi:hypothetical protein